ncbi:hypothetical protein [Brevundimonas sp. GCM10030266]|uniref:hypothetical protein n=1 Tax=Brevundimonas sp. GCM10030266 TaxID=3273386 RepID=UPI00361148F0
MQGHIAQSIGLTLAANARHQGLAAARWPDASVFLFCKHVRFVRRGTTAYADPEQWLASTGSGAVLRVASRNNSGLGDRESVGFAGGGPLLIVPTGTQSAWWSDWQVGDSNAEDRRIWTVTYHETAPPPAPRQPPATAHDGKARLVRALDKAIAFASAQQMGFDDYLAKSTRLLDAPEPLADFYHPDIIPEGLMDLEHAQLFGCAAASWVFGGMGSWNDVWFQGDVRAEYDRVSDQLFSSIIDALVTATNSTLRP